MEADTIEFKEYPTPRDEALQLRRVEALSKLDLKGLAPGNVKEFKEAYRAIRRPLGSRKVCSRGS